MTVMYARIYKEAAKQETLILAAESFQMMTKANELNQVDNAVLAMHNANVTSDGAKEHSSMSKAVKRKNTIGVK